MRNTASLRRPRCRRFRRIQRSGVPAGHRVTHQNVTTGAQRNADSRPREKSDAPFGDATRAFTYRFLELSSHGRDLSDHILRGKIRLTLPNTQFIRIHFSQQTSVWRPLKLAAHFPRLTNRETAKQPHNRTIENLIKPSPFAQKSRRLRYISR